MPPSRSVAFYEQLLAVEVSLNDGAAVGKIHPLAVSGYLESHGWAKQDLGAAANVPPDVFYYGHSEHPDSQLIALAKHFRDYSNRIGETITALSGFEKRSELAISERVLTGSGGLNGISPRTP